MKFIPVLLAMFLVVCTMTAQATPTPIRRDHRVLVNRPTRDDMFNARVRRADPFGFKGRPALTPSPIVRKGEYMCGNKTCRVKPGPQPGCIRCQYPIF